MDSDNALAVFFMNQCIGEHNGEMASKPNNHVIQDLFIAMGFKYSSDGKKRFAQILRYMANSLDPMERS